jgi:predicted DNA-binding transcriptional regulator AlpA
MKLLSFPELKTKFGIPYTRRHINVLEAAGRFPKAVKLSPGQQGHVAWVEAEIAEHVARLAAQRGQASA